MSTQQTNWKHCFFIGIAIFTMVFGAGNIVFPLLVGNLVGTKFFFAFCGIFLSSVFLPMLGFFACLNFGGKYQQFLASWIGWWPTQLTAILAMLILGPLGCIPRCATLAHAALAWNLWPNLPLFWFSVAFFSLISGLALQKNLLINILGKVLGPINLIFMLIFILKGLWTPGQLQTVDIASSQAFSFGFFEAYKTYDLLAMIFYAFSIVAAISAYLESNGFKASQELINDFSRKGALVAAGIFSSIYFAFCLVAAKHAFNIPGTVKENLISAYSTSLLGNQLGVLAGIIVVLACLNSACALTVVFVEFMDNFTQRFGINYTQNIILCSIISFGFSNFGFQGIEQAVAPLTQLVYPVLILITLLSIANTGLRSIRA